MLLTKEIKMRWSSTNKKWYVNKGYIFTKIGDLFIVDVEDLSKGCNTIVETKCDRCGKISKNKWVDYKKQVKDGKTYCYICGHNLFANENARKTKLKNSISFEQWCIDNNRQDILNRWDYDLNKYKPNEISYSTKIKCYFKCPKEIHKSELKDIHSFIKGQEGSIQCNQCNSISQWLINTYGKNAIKLYWSNKNKKSPYEYSLYNTQQVWWKCPNGKHKDYKRTVCGSTIHNCHCPSCQFSKGEKRIMDWLILNGFINIRQKEYNEAMYTNSILDKHFVPQKEFEDLIGLGNGKLSYDFYLPTYNLLIEYQGEFHDGTVSYQTENDFMYQQEHDKRKSNML